MADLVKPEMPEFYSPGRVLLSAFAATAAINQHRAQLQQQLMEMDLRNKQFQQKQMMDQKGYELALGRLNEETRYHKVEADNQAKTQKRLSDAAIAESNAQTVEDGRVTGLTQAIAGIDAKPGTAEWGSAFNNAQMEYSDVWGTPAAKRVWGPQYAKHMSGAGALTQSISKAQADYAAAVRNTRAKVDPRYFNYPGMWSPTSQPVAGEPSMFIGVDDKGEPVPMDDKGKIPTGKKVGTFFTIPKAQFDNIQQLRARAFALESTDKPDLSALPPGMAPGTAPTTRTVEYGKHHYEVDDSTKQIVRQID